MNGPCRCWVAPDRHDGHCCARSGRDCHMEFLAAVEDAAGGDHALRRLTSDQVRARMATALGAMT